MDPIRTPTVTPTKQNQHPQTFDPDSPAKTPAGRKSEVKSLLRSAPGSRGPTPTSCEGCRRLRVKCVRENGGQVGTESCASCNKRGMECRVPQEITRRRAIPSLPARYRPPPRQFELDVFNVYLQSGRKGLVVVPLLFSDAYHLQQRFLAAGRQLENLEEHEQLRCRILWSLSAAESGQASNGEAESFADSLGIWRKVNHSNFSSLVLLFLATASGELVVPQAYSYLASAASQFPQLFTASLTSQQSGRPEWSAYIFALIDIAVAIEQGTVPLLSAQDLVALPAPQLPESSSLASVAAQSLAHFVDYLTPAIASYIEHARNLAVQFSKPLEAVTLQQDYAVLHSTLEALDAYHLWAVECFAHLRSPQFEIESAERTMAESAITVHWVSPLFLELSTLTYLRRRLEAISQQQTVVQSEHDPNSSLSVVASLVFACEDRSEWALCSFLRHTRNADQLYLLSATAGMLFSTSRLSDLALILVDSDANDLSLFPVTHTDKLASVTFLLESIKQIQTSPGNEDLESTLTLLEDAKAELASNVGYSGDSALSLFTSILPSSGRPLDIVKESVDMYNAPYPQFVEEGMGEEFRGEEVMGVEYQFI